MADFSAQLFEVSIAQKRYKEAFEELRALLSDSVYDDLRHRLIVSYGLIPLPGSPAGLDPSELRKAETAFSDAFLKILREFVSLKRTLEEARAGNKVVRSFTCDRKDHRENFEAYREGHRTSQRKFFVHVVPGEKVQSPHALFKNISHTVLASEGSDQVSQVEKLVLEPSQELERTKNQLLALIFSKLGSGQARGEADFSAEQLAKCPVALGKDSLAVEIQVRTTAWKDFLPELMRWFAQDFLRSSEPRLEGCAFHFFFNIEFEKDEGKGFLGLFSKSPKKKILASLIDLAKRHRELHLMDELPPVKRPDVLYWLEDAVGEARANQLLEAYIDKKFPGQSEYEMIKLLGILDEIITQEINKTYH